MIITSILATRETEKTGPKIVEHLNNLLSRECNKAARTQRVSRQKVKRKTKMSSRGQGRGPDKSG